MLLAEDPATLIHHTINNFNVQCDKQAVARANDSLATLQQGREKHLRDTTTVLRRLARQHAALTAHHADLVNAHAAADHASKIATLDTRKFRTAKSASDAEGEAERLEAVAADLAARLAELEARDVEGGLVASRGDAVDDEVLLRLKVYRSLGIEIERDGEGEWSRAVIRNERRGDVHVVNMDKKFSRFFYANYFWQTV
ncbi:kinetochore protein SPC24 [Ophiocordyceps camponoti-floridani]|uniref:Kinetochore protein Spc24 n=1 Tax=Ophiocordyceps camponoti-floridani TaxID=2030778 RepID=A0A8H4Q6C6_9HYPO|nr:kinetochore protein SPC24 [Ophiocordyceps camponoti-floridani]